MTEPRMLDEDLCLPTLAQVEVRRARAAGWQDALDHVAEETPVALEYNGISHAVMLATPADLEDFALGFSLSEGILASASELYDCEVIPDPHGVRVAHYLAQAAGCQHLDGEAAACAAAEKEALINAIVKHRRGSLAGMVAGFMWKEPPWQELNRFSPTCLNVHGENPLDSALCIPIRIRQDIFQGNPMPYSGMQGKAPQPDAESLSLTTHESMRDRLHKTDWSKTSLGPIGAWDPALTNAVSLCQNSKYSLMVLAGEELICIYNDALVPALEAKHPAAFGRPAQQVWPETWDTIGPMLRGVQLSGKAVRHNDRALLVRRSGQPRRRYFTFSYSPVLGSTGKVVAVFVVTLETTARVVQERRLEMLNRLASGIASAFSPDQIFACAAQALRTNPEDIPLSALYLCEHNGNLRLAFQAEHAAGGTEILPASLPAADASYAADGLPASVRRAMRRARMESFDLPQAVPGPDGKPLTQAVALPINLPGALTTQGVFVVALNPLIPWDEDYRSFLTVVLGHLGTGLAAYEAAQETSSFLSIVFEHAPSGMAIADANGVLMRANDAYASLRGLPKELLPGTPMQSAYSPAPEQDHAPLRQLLLQAAAGWSRETRYARYGGGTVWVAEQMSLVRDGRGQPRFVVITTRDISETVSAKQEAQAARDELGRLYERLQSIREEERVAIAREVHDQLGQVLSAAKIDIDLLAQRLVQHSDPLTREEARNELQSAQSALDRALGLVRVIASELRAARLQEQGLYAAVRWHARDFQQRTRIRCQVQIADGLHEPEGECAVTLFRIMQEALTNVLRHAGASGVTVSFHPRGTAIKLRVHDDGAGISRGAVRNTTSLGVRGMRERAALHGGRLLIGACCAGHGTLVSALIPLSPEDKPDAA